MKLKAGDRAPDFSLPDQDGKTHALKDYAGGWLLLYFYPKDDTPGCTKEACNFRDGYAKFRQAGLAVAGVSADSVKSHAKFVKKYDLPFTLLADEEKKTVNDYGVWGKKKFMGREYMGIFRNSYLISPDGRVAKAYEGVKPDEHADEVLKDIAELR